MYWSGLEFTHAWATLANDNGARCHIGDGVAAANACRNYGDWGMNMEKGLKNWVTYERRSTRSLHRLYILYTM